MSLPAFAFAVPAEHAPLFAYRLGAALGMYGEPKEGPREASSHCRLHDALRAFDKTAPEWTIPTELLSAFCDALAYWVSQTQDDCEAAINRFAFELLERAKEEERKSIIDYVAEIRLP